MGEPIKVSVKPEGINIEYKKSTNSLPKDFWKTYSAFANTSGGLVVLGISEKSNNFYLEGISEDDITKILKELHTSLNNREKVNYNMIDDSHITIYTLHDRKVIEININEAPLSKKPICLNGDYRQTFIRSNDSDRKATDDELRSMIRNSKDDLDSEVLDGFHLDDLNGASIEDYRKVLIGNNENSPYIGMDIEQLLVELGAMKKDRQDGGKYKITLGGLLFFGKYNSITDAFPHFHLDYFNRSGANDRWIDRVATGDPKYPEMNIFSFFQIVLEKLKLTVHEEFQLSSNSNRILVSEDVEISLRESLANALIHADYFVNDPIKIEGYNGYYEFYNPGEMKISVEEFVKGGNSKPRNNTIATLFRRVGFCERAGSGGPKIFQVAKKNKQQYPDILSENNTTMIKIWKVDIVDAHPELSDNEKNILKYITKQSTALTSKEIQTNLGITRHHATTAITSLIQKELLEQIGQARSTRYQLKETTPEYITSIQHSLRNIQKNYIDKGY
ncbi:RNA-binding domain-containing protein [Listeria booriae]|uniref:RNA-binding domain-containing protein n=1 Tax=Listeria booriae TaxID=1552123 RepID=UPI0016232676|nr:RNA-binding domain-containing protein [Listeria booriae]MBC2257529.1 ATP-dependent DNA helicase RecG [Listeria booriae]